MPKITSIFAPTGMYNLLLIVTSASSVSLLTTASVAISILPLVTTNSFITAPAFTTKVFSPVLAVTFSQPPLISTWSMSSTVRVPLEPSGTLIFTASAPPDTPFTVKLLVLTLLMLMVTGAALVLLAGISILSFAFTVLTVMLLAPSFIAWTASSAFSTTLLNVIPPVLASILMSLMSGISFIVPAVTTKPLVVLNAWIEPVPICSVAVIPSA